MSMCNIIVLAFLFSAPGAVGTRVRISESNHLGRLATKQSTEQASAVMKASLEEAANKSKEGADNSLQQDLAEQDTEGVVEQAQASTDSRFPLRPNRIAPGANRIPARPPGGGGGGGGTSELCICRLASKSFDVDCSQSPDMEMIGARCRRRSFLGILPMVPAFMFPRKGMAEPSNDVISGGQLPLTVALGMGPPYPQRYVELAIDAGYRLFDTAQEYGSEEGLGNALKAAFSSGKLKRQDVFVTTKVDIYNMGYDKTISSVRESFDKLGRLEGGIDLVLIHWPCPFVPKDDPGAIEANSKLRRKTWEALEKLQQDGIVKQIGVSNFGKRHLKELLGYAKVRPAVDQVEVHPYNQRVGLEKLVKSEGIRFEAYSPLGKGRIGLFEDPVLTKIADTKKKPVAAIIIRWLLQRDITPIALSRNEERIKENLDVFDFNLTDDEMSAIAKLDRGQFVIMDDEELA